MVDGRTALIDYVVVYATDGDRHDAD